jgi:predicted nucleotidyltransferase
VRRTGSPSLLPIFRSQQQAELLSIVLGDPTIEFTLADLTTRTGIPYASVHREVERARAAGLVSVRLIGRTQVITADETSPYFTGLSDVLVKAFGVPWVIADALRDVERIDEAYIFGSWAARSAGVDGVRPVGDIDLLILGSPDREAIYALLSRAEERLGRSIQVTLRETDWLTNGTGSFHDTVVERPKVSVRTTGGTEAEDVRSEGAPRRPPSPSRSTKPTKNRQR